MKRSFNYFASIRGRRSNGQVWVDFYSMHKWPFYHAWKWMDDDLDQIKAELTDFANGVRNELTQRG